MEIKGKNLAERLQYIRTQRDWTQSEAAERADLALRTYQDIEYGKNKNPGITGVIRLSQAFDVSVEELTGTTTRRLMAEGLARKTQPLSPEMLVDALGRLLQESPDYQRLILAMIYKDVTPLRALPHLAPLIPPLERLIKFHK